MREFIDGRTLWHCANLPGPDEADYLDPEEEKRTQVTNWAKANLIGSLLESGLHAPAIDIDFAAELDTNRVLRLQVPEEGLVMGDEELDEACIGLVVSGMVRSASYLRLPGQSSGRVRLALSAPSLLVPSKTCGHFHLYSTSRLTWDEYRGVLSGMSYLGIIQHGFHQAALKRGMSLLRIGPLASVGGQCRLFDTPEGLGAGV